MIVVEVMLYVINYAAWILYYWARMSPWMAPWMAQWPFPQAMLCAGMLYSLMAASLLAVGDPLQGMLCALLAALWFWLYWSRRPPQRRRRKVGARVVVLGHGLGVSST